MGALDHLRAELDRLDRTLVETLRARLDTVADIVRVKAEGLPFLRDHERESQLLERSAAWARELGLDPFRVQEMFREVVAMSLKAQEEALLGRERIERSSRAAGRGSTASTSTSKAPWRATRRRWPSPSCVASVRRCGSSGRTRREPPRPARSIAGTTAVEAPPGRHS